uniref:Corticotropin-releasing factor domain-containing protein n=1 Tax=Graphocephala atropunctata TaxID=36148 RepID=A0A1B6KGZ6_9HEMI
MFLRHLTVVCLAALLVVPLTQSRPYRQKRPSDQRVNELQTLYELSQMSGGLVNLPVGLDLNPELLGRRRRSSERLLQELLDGQEERTRDDDENPRWLAEIV